MGSDEELYLDMWVPPERSSQCASLVCLTAAETPTSPSSEPSKLVIGGGFPPRIWPPGGAPQPLRGCCGGLKKGPRILHVKSICHLREMRAERKRETTSTLQKRAVIWLRSSHPFYLKRLAPGRRPCRGEVGHTLGYPPDTSQETEKSTKLATYFSS